MRTISSQLHLQAARTLSNRPRTLRQQFVALKAVRRATFNATVAIEFVLNQLRVRTDPIAKLSTITLRGIKPSGILATLHKRRWKQPTSKAMQLLLFWRHHQERRRNLEIPPYPKSNLCETHVLGLSRDMERSGTYL